MNDRPIPQVGELYQHYENHNIYQVLGISKDVPRPDNIQYWAVSKFGSLKKTGQAIAIYQTSDGLILFDGVSCLSNHIAYQCITGEYPPIWIAPVSEFLEILGDEPTFFYRFTKVAQ